MERICVTVRARPLSLEESKCSPWRISGNSISLPGQSTAKFEFDRVFGEECKTVEVYAARMKEIVASAVCGFNGTIFAYGQTNSGKTHTMRGTDAEPGIIPLAVRDLFQSMQEKTEREFLIRMSYMEIYNEDINDLLVPEHRKLQIHESLERGIYVAGLREEIVASPEQVLHFMEFGESHRHIGETNMNLYSSRSHTIFCMIVESREKAEEGDSAVRVSVLNLVDLAGSERAAKTGAGGMRLKEGSHINKSLMTLGTVIKKLSEGAESQGGHVPYRDSKLTRILQPALGGNANTAIICNITLSQVHTDETKSSLQFASRALCVKNFACVNEIMTDAALLKRQRKEIEELRGKLLASHSEHWEQEILNLRNTLLQSELEKERIALELEEEKKAKAHREKRLLEQAKKIANLSSLVLCSERDGKSSHISKDKRRVTWCPGPSGNTEVFGSCQVTDVREPIQDEQNLGLPPPFNELLQESEFSIDNHHTDDAYLPQTVENEDKWEHFSLPDARALLHVTNRRKMHGKGNSSTLESSESPEKRVRAEYEPQIPDYAVQRQAKDDEIERLTHKLVESEYTPTRTSVSPSLRRSSISASCVRRSLTVYESEAILVIKQLEDQIKSLDLEKTCIQRNLDDVVQLATEQNASFREKYEQLQQEVLIAREELSIAHKQCPSAISSGTSKEGPDCLTKLSMEMQGIALEVDSLRSTTDNNLSTVKDLFQSFSSIPEALMEVKSLVSQDMVYLSSIITGHNKINSYMKGKIDELELQKNLLHQQSLSYEQKIKDLGSDLVNLEKAMAEQVIQHELEKDELLSHVLCLQKEASCLSSSSLLKEKEALRKELDRTKSKLKDTESKLKNTIQDKIKLESDRAQAEREIKQLHGQRALLERGILKRDSFIDKRRESKSFDVSKTKGLASLIEQSLQEDYQKLEVRAFEMEAEIASLKETLITVYGEREESFAQNELLASELEVTMDRLKATNSEVQLLVEEIAGMTKRLGESEDHAKKLEASLELLYAEKEEMAMQLTDALLEVEAEKSTWLAKERAFLECSEKLKISEDEVLRLSEDLVQVGHELESCREECSLLMEKLILSEENYIKERESSMLRSSEIGQHRNEVDQYIVGSMKCADAMPKSDMSSEHNHACLQVQKLQGQLAVLLEEKDELAAKVKELDKTSNFSQDYQEVLNNNKEVTKLRLRLRSTQAKLEAFRARYKEAVEEMMLMNKRFEEASRKLKEQLGAYGVEILRLKKQLATKE